MTESEEKILLYVARFGAFFDPTVQRVLERYPDADDPAGPIRVFFALNRLAIRSPADIRDAALDFALEYHSEREGYPEYVAQLLLALTRFHGKRDAEVTLEELVMDYGYRPPPRDSDWTSSIGAQTETGQNNFIEEKWHAIAFTISENHVPKGVKGDTLRTSLFPAYIKKRAMILTRWLPAIKAYFKPS